MRNLKPIFTAETAKHAELFLLFFLCGLGALCGKAFCGELKFRFQPGDKYSLVSVTEQKMSRVVDGNEKSSEQTTRLECDFDIEEVDENVFAWARYAYKRVTMKLRSEEQKIEFDSDANQLKAPMQAMPLRLAIGESVYLRITPQGQIEKINGLQALITNAKAKMGDFSGAGAVSQSIERQFAGPAVRRELENQLAVFPDSNGAGEIWGRREVLSSADVGYTLIGQIEEVNIVYEKTFRLNPTAVRGGIAMVDVNLTIKPVTVAANMPASGAQARANREISGEGAGQIEIEEATGRIISSKMTQDTAERVKFAAQGQKLRPPPSPEPIITHTVTTFQMTKIAEGKPVEGETSHIGGPAQPADAN